MPAIAALTITDSTPTNHTFNPVQNDVNRSVWMKRDSDLAAASMSLIQDFKEPTGGSKVYRTGLRLNYPLKVGDSATPVNYTVSDVARFHGEYILPEGMSDTDRAHFEAMVLDMIGDANLKKAVTDLEPSY